MISILAKLIYKFNVIPIRRVSCGLDSQGSNSNAATHYRGPQPPGPWTTIGLKPVRNQASQQEVSGGRSVTCRSPSLALLPEPSLALPPKPSPPTPPNRGKIVFHKTGPWCQEVGDHWLTIWPWAGYFTILYFSYVVRWTQIMYCFPFEFLWRINKIINIKCLKYSWHVVRSSKNVTYHCWCYIKNGRSIKKRNKQPNRE